MYAEKSTSEKLEEAQKTEEETEDKLDETSDKLEDLRDTQSELKSNLSDLNNKLENVSDKLSDIEESIRKKEDEIADAGEALETAEEEAKKQYKYIKARIRTQYEKGKESYLELFLNTSNFSLEKPSSTDVDISGTGIIRNSRITIIVFKTANIRGFLFVRIDISTY